MIENIIKAVRIMRASKKGAEKILSNVPDEKAFYVNDGKVLRNIRDLPGALVDMAENTYSFHVNKEKNDFRNWIDEVVGDKKLARELSRTRSKDVFLRKLDRRINQLESAMK